jgi:catechol 2,3-dioxygenase-like lactoylglutathione lyase family enzyme
MGHCDESPDSYLSLFLPVPMADFLTRLDHIQLAIPADSEDVARQFYEGILGLTEVPKPEPLQSRGGCWFVGPEFMLHLGVEQDFAPARKAHPAFLSTDLESLRQHLLHSGVRVTLDESVPGVPRFYAMDPFGNRLEFIQEGKGFYEPH